jgi:hypothetical protein
MSVFAVIASSNPSAVGTAIVAQYGANHYQFTNNVWFVSDNGTTKDVSDRLGISNGVIGAQGVVLKFDNYSGYAATAGWQWLSRQSGVFSNG